MAAGKLALKNGSYATLIGVNGQPENDIEFNIPADSGQSGQTLITDGNGNLVWGNAVNTTGSYSFTNGISEAGGTVKLGNELVKGTDTNIGISNNEDYSGFTTFNINDSRNKAGLYINKGYDDSISQRVSSTKLGSAFTGSVFGGSMEMENCFQSYSEAKTNVGQYGNELYRDGYSDIYSYIKNTSNAITDTRLRISAINEGLRLLTNESYTGSPVGTYELVSYPGTGLRQTKFNGEFDVNGYTGLLSSYNTTISSAKRTTTTTSNINCITQNFTINSSATSPIASIDLLTRRVSVIGTYDRRRNGEITLGGLDFSDKVNRVSYQNTYAPITVIPFDFKIDSSFGSTAYDRSVFKVDLTASSNNYIFGTYPILSSSAQSYGSLSAVSTLASFRNNGSEIFAIKAGGSILLKGDQYGHEITSLNPGNPGRLLISGGDYNTKTSWGTEWFFDISNGNFTASGDVISFGTSIGSDIKLKENIVSVSNKDCLDSVLLLDPKKYNFIKTKDRVNFGFIAQEVESIIPNIVNNVKTNDGEFLSIRYNEVVPLLVGAIKKLNKEIEDLKNGFTGINTRN